MQQLFQEIAVQEALPDPENRESWRRHYLSSLAEMPGFLDDLLKRLRRAGYSAAESFAIRLALEEAIVNAVKHGHKQDASKEVEVCYRVTDTWLVVQVRDQGPGFDPSQVPDPLADENIDREGGRGLHLMRAYMSWVSYNETGNCVTMCKRRALPAG
jgi:serine/threonine-protein kinase RsbW